MPGGAPWLASVNFLRASGATISYRYSLAHFEELDPLNVYELKVMTSGHLGLALHDYQGDRHRKFPIGNRTVPWAFREIAEALRLENAGSDTA